MGAGTRDRLVHAARDLIHDATFADVSVDDVCRAAGVNKGSLYHFFPSKDALGMAVLDQNWAMMAAVLDRAFEPDIPPLDRIDRFVTQFQGMLAGMGDRFGRSPGCPLGNMAAEFSTQEPAMRRRLTVIFDDYTTYFSNAIAQARQVGDVPRGVDPDRAATAVVAYIQGMAALAKTYDDPSVITRLQASVRQLATSPTT